MKNMKTFENFEEKENNWIDDFIDKLNISEDFRATLRTFVNELLEEDDMEEQMDMVDNFFIDCDDEDVCDEIDSFLRDLV